MKRIFTYGCNPEHRHLTVGDKISNKSKGVKMTQVTADDKQQAQLVDELGIDLIITLGDFYDEVRAGAPNTFITTALLAHQYVSNDAILSEAIRLASKGADAIITPRGIGVVEMLAKEGICVQGHIGMVPHLSTSFGGIRMIGKTAKEAMSLMEQVRRLEDAGAYGVEVECVAEEVLAEISKRTSLVTSSIGSGRAGDIIFLFMSDICGETEKLPRHAKAWGDIGSLLKQIHAERKKALTGFRDEVANGTFPGAAHSASMLPGEHDLFLEELDKYTPLHQ